MTNLTKLPNIGPTLAEKLNQIGVTTFDELAEMGSIEALTRIGQTNKPACYNMLYALEGAIARAALACDSQGGTRSTEGGI